MNAFASFEGSAVELSRPPAPVLVYRYLPAGADAESEPASWEFLPNVLCLGVSRRVGADPGTARFRYVTDGSLSYDPEWPWDWRQLLDPDTDGPYVVRPDDRIVVRVPTPDPDAPPRVLFDGFAMLPQVDLSRQGARVEFIAVGVAVRASDGPLSRFLWRNADSVTTLEDRRTDHPGRINPDGRPNAVGAAGWSGTGGRTFPVFVATDGPGAVPWTVASAIRMCLFDFNDQVWVTDPAPEEIDAAGLGPPEPDPDAAALGPPEEEEEGPEGKPVVAPDLVLDGRRWPALVDQLVTPLGWSLAFDTRAADDGSPETIARLLRVRDAGEGPVKDLYIQPYGEPLDPGRTNLGAARFGRDASEVRTVVAVQLAPDRHEVSVVLAPGFEIDPADASDAAHINAFVESARGDAGEKYREFVYDELGSGHWKLSTGEWVDDAPTPLLGVLGDGHPYRPRPGLGRLFTIGPSGPRGLPWRLDVSADYAGASPGVWDGTGTWRPAEGASLLPDRLGVRVDAPNPNGWHVGRLPGLAGDPYPSGVIPLVEALAKAGKPRPALRLTCVIEGDTAPEVRSGPSHASPTGFEIVEYVDARDRYRRHLIAAHSHYNLTAKPYVARDDTGDARREADARLRALEAGSVAGPVTIPRASFAYELGDRIRSVVGTDLSLRTNAGTEAEPTYPVVVGIEWHFDGGQSTTLELSDGRR